MGLFSLPKHPRFVENYVSGFPFQKTKTGVTIEVAPEGLYFKLLVGFKTKDVFIPKEDIIEIGLNSETYRSAGKAAAGAIVGGILTGGIGLLAGAALGGRRKKDNELTLVIEYEKEACYIELKSSKSIPKLYQEIRKIMPVEPENITTNDSAEQIAKFAELKEKGIITAEEFEAKKKQLLGL